MAATSLSGTDRTTDGAHPCLWALSGPVGTSYSSREIQVVKERNRKRGSWGSGFVLWIVRVIGKLSSLTLRVWIEHAAAMGASLTRRVWVEHAAAMGASLTRRVWVEQLGWRALRNERRGGPQTGPSLSLRDVPPSGACHPCGNLFKLFTSAALSRSRRGGGCRGRRSGRGRGARWPGAWPSPGRRGRRRGRQWGTPGAGGRGSGSRGSWI